MGSSFLTLLVSFFAFSGSGPIAVPMLPIISRVASFMSAHAATCLRNAAAGVRAGCSSWLPDFRLLAQSGYYELGNFAAEGQYGWRDKDGCLAA